MTPRREPIFNIPAVILGLVAVMALIHLWRSTMSAADDLALVSRFAFVPGRFTALFDRAGVVSRIAAWTASANPDLRRQGIVAGYLVGNGPPSPIAFLSYAFLHGSWVHFGLNSVWMLAFGTPVARRFGVKRFLVFMAAAAAAGALTHWICFPFGFAPVIGASAAVSGLMGGALRFMFQGGRGTDDLYTGPALSLRAVLADRRALSFLAVWFVTNALFGVGAQSLGVTDAPIAWQAHVGGFLLGLLLFPLFDPPQSGNAAPMPEPLPALSESPPAERSL